MIEFTLWDIVRNLLLATRWTVLLSVIALVGGAVVGVAILLARISARNWVSRAAQTYIGLFQGTPLLMQLFLMFFGLPMLGFRIEPWTRRDAQEEDGEPDRRAADEGGEREQHRPAGGEQQVADDVPEGELDHDTPTPRTRRPPATSARRTANDRQR